MAPSLTITSALLAPPRDSGPYACACVAFRPSATAASARSRPASTMPCPPAPTRRTRHWGASARSAVAGGGPGGGGPGPRRARPPAVAAGGEARTEALLVEQLVHAVDLEPLSLEHLRPAPETVVPAEVLGAIAQDLDEGEAPVAERPDDQVAVAGDHDHVQVGTRELEPRREGERPALRRVERAKLHVADDPAGAADARD